MSWLNDMKADAVLVAFGEQAALVQPEDEIVLDVEHDEGYRYSSYTYEDPHFRITVSVPARRLSMSYDNDEAQEFMIALMAAGSARERS